jgi:hypothetical protein
LTPVVSAGCTGGRSGCTNEETFADMSVFQLPAIMLLLDVFVGTIVVVFVEVVDVAFVGKIVVVFAIIVLVVIEVLVEFAVVEMEVDVVFVLFDMFAINSFMLESMALICDALSACVALSSVVLDWFPIDVVLNEES